LAWTTSASSERRDSAWFSARLVIGVPPLPKSWPPVLRILMPQPLNQFRLK